MSTGSEQKGRLTPRDILRRYMSPLSPPTTRRQVLQSLGLGVAAVGCGSSSPGDAAGPNPAFTPGGSNSAGNSANSPGTTGASANPSSIQPTAAPTSAETPPSQPAPAPEATQPTSTTEASPTSEGTATPSEGETAEDPLPQTETVEAPESLSGQPMGRSAYDLVELGTTGIVTSRIAMGSGTTGFDGSSAQTSMGAAYTRLLIDGFERGVRFYDAADAYGSHGVVGDALQQVGRGNVTLLTKTLAETRADAESDLDRFMEELQTDYIDIVLLHIRTSPNWVAESEGAMEALAEAKAAGRIRAHGVSCHSLEAMQLAAATDWVDVNLCRINPFSLHMDGEPSTIVRVLEQMQAAGQATVGMKILGQGDAVDRFDEAIQYATRLEYLHGFTIGFRSLDELNQVAESIASVTHA